MLDSSTIRKLFKAQNGALREKDVIGDVGLCGGDVMCLVFNARRSTKDVDAIFKPTAEIREASAKIARKFGVPKDWLNDAAKGYFLSTPPSVDVLNFSNLRVWAPTAEYMLAMKCVSARFDTTDTDDVKFLLEHLGLKRPADVFRIAEKYYPRKRIPPKTGFLVEELLQSE